MFDRRWKFPESFDVGDVLMPIGEPVVVPAVTCTASGGEQLLIGLRARRYVAWSGGEPVDGFHIYIVDEGTLCPWKGNTMCLRRHTIRDAAVAALSASGGVSDV